MGVTRRSGDRPNVIQTAEASDASKRTESPILPVELWRMILAVLEEEGDCLAVIRFMGVCKLFRQIVHSVKQLVRVSLFARCSCFVLPTNTMLAYTKDMQALHCLVLESMDNMFQSHLYQARKAHSAC